MTQVVLDLDVVEEEVLKRLLDMGLFGSPQEAFKIALLKYSMDLGIMKDMKGNIDPKIVPNLDQLALKAAPEDQENKADPQDIGPEEVEEDKDDEPTGAGDG